MSACMIAMGATCTDDTARQHPGGLSTAPSQHLPTQPRARNGRFDRLTKLKPSPISSTSDRATCTTEESLAVGTARPREISPRLVARHHTVPDQPFPPKHPGWAGWWELLWAYGRVFALFISSFEMCWQKQVFRGESSSLFGPKENIGTRSAPPRRCRCCAVLRSPVCRRSTQLRCRRRGAVSWPKPAICAMENRVALARSLTRDHHRPNPAQNEP